MKNIYDKIVEEWNLQSDIDNQWEVLSEKEKSEFFNKTITIINCKSCRWEFVIGNQKICHNCKHNKKLKDNYEEE